MALGLLLERFEPQTLRRALEAYIIEARARQRAELTPVTPLFGLAMKKEPESIIKLGLDGFEAILIQP